MSMEMIEKYKFIAILRHIKPEYIHKSAEALYNGGIRIFEVTFNPSSSTTIKDTKYIISEIYNMYGEEVCVGAGATIITPQLAESGQFDVIEKNARAHVEKIVK